MHFGPDIYPVRPSWIVNRPTSFNPLAVFFPLSNWSVSPVCRLCLHFNAAEFADKSRERVHLQGGDFSL